MSGIRLSKLMAERGLCSRREADRLIEQGKVLVNGQVVDRLGSRFDPTVCIALAPEIQRERLRLVTVLLNKPPGVVSNQPGKSSASCGPNAPRTSFRKNPARCWAT